MSRRQGRIIAFQGLYSWDAGGMSKDEVLTLSWTENEAGKETVDAETAAFARLLIAGTIENQQEIDGQISSHLSGWDFDRVNKVSLAILRMSVYSLLFMKEIQPSIVIDEAIHIAKEYGQDDSYKFINGVLDNIHKANPSAAE